MAQQTQRVLAAGTIANNRQEHDSSSQIRARATEKMDGITATHTHTHSCLLGGLVLVPFAHKQNLQVMFGALMGFFTFIFSNSSLL